MSLAKTDRDDPVGVFPRLGRLAARRPWLVIGVWIALAGVLALTAPSLEEISQQHPVAILPSDAPVLTATRTMNAAFGEAGLQSIAVVVLSDAKGLSAADEATYRKLTEALPGIIASVAGFSCFDVIRHAKSHLLIGGTVPGVSAMGLALSVIAAAIPLAIGHSLSGLSGLILSTLASLALGALAFHLAVRAYKNIGS